MRLEILQNPEGWQESLDAGLTPQRIYFYFRERGSGHFRCSTCFSLVWHSDAIPHAYIHAVSRSSVSYAIESAMEPEDLQYVVCIQYLNGRFKAPERMMLGKMYTEEHRRKVSNEATD